MNSSPLEFHLSFRVSDWRGTPLHELWLRDPTGYGIEVYARLTPEELKEMPVDQEPCYLVSGTEP